MTAISATGLSKVFGQTRALSSVDFQADYGEIHAVLGENGAGKTTLMRLIHGQISADEGSLDIDGGPLRIGMVSQHYSIIPELDCLDNLMLGAEPSRFIDRCKAMRRAQDLAARMGFEFDWLSPASLLSPAQAQKLEILKLLWRGSRIMILDEPTAMLSPGDSEALYRSLAALAADGACIVVITHQLRDVINHCSKVTVLRQGSRVASCPAKETSIDELAELVVGGVVHPANFAEPRLGEAILHMDGVSVTGSRGDMALKDADFEVRQGEVVGIAGIDGSGQQELVRAILGVLKPRSGTMKVFGQEGLSVEERLRQGLRLIPENRLDEGLIQDWSLIENAVLGLQRVPPFANGKAVDQLACNALAERAARLLDTRFSSLNQPIRELSGGSQQRFIAGRALAHKPRLILAFQPARGLDIRGASAVYDAIRSACRTEQAGALVVSFDLDELLEQCDRLLVMCRGIVMTPPNGCEKDRLEIGRMMMGAA